MLYHVSSFRLLYMGPLEADHSVLIPQLRRIWSRDGNLSSHVLVSLVRVTVETNLVTSKHLGVFDVMMHRLHLTLVQPPLVSFHC
jgi:hypothetical protein